MTDENAPSNLDDESPPQTIEAQEPNPEQAGTAEQQPPEIVEAQEQPKEEAHQESPEVQAAVEEERPEPVEESEPDFSTLRRVLDTYDSMKAELDQLTANPPAKYLRVRYLAWESKVKGQSAVVESLFKKAVAEAKIITDRREHHLLVPGWVCKKCEAAFQDETAMLPCPECKSTEIEQASHDTVIAFLRRMAGYAEVVEPDEVVIDVFR